VIALASALLLAVVPTGAAASAAGTITSVAVASPAAPSATVASTAVASSASSSAAKWPAWMTVAPVVLSDAARPRLVRLRMPAAIDPGPDATYPDLRLVDDGGTETAYAFAADDEGAAAGARAVALVDTGFVPGAYTQAVLDLGDERALHDEVALETPRATYFERVSVDASDDRATWRRVREGAVIYRVAQDNGRGSARIAFPPTYSRWLRVRIADPQAPFALSGATVARGNRPQPVLEPLPVAATPQTDPASHRQSWTFAGRVALRPTAVAFAGGSGTYVRRVTVASSDDGTTWNDAGEGTIARYARGGAQSSFAFAQATAPRWRVTVENGSDPPVAGLRPTLLARPRELLFRAAPHRGYALLSGNPHAAAPQYDLAAQLAHERARPDAGATLGALADNPAYDDARPLLERFPWLLTTVLLVIAGLMALLAVRTLRASKA
jgi:hypothetical protein